MPLIRVDRLLANRGLGSRREVRAAIKRGRVRLGDRVLRDEAEKIPDDATLHVDGDALAPPPWLAILHKPVGVHSTVGDPLGRDNLATIAADLLALGLHPVGRLDHDSEGLLAFSRDGALTQRLLHPRHAVPKRYRALVQGALPADLGARLAAGVPTADGPATATLIAIEPPNTVVLSVTEGRHRIVRRMLANLGLPVQRLIREELGELSLGALAVGAWRPATADEVAWARGLIAP